MGNYAKYKTIPADGSESPADTIRNHWNLFADREVCLAFLNTVTTYSAAIVYRLSSAYGAAMVIGYDGNTVSPVYMRLDNGAWTTS